MSKTPKKVEPPRFNRVNYEKHFDKLISKVKKKNENLSEPVELMYLQNDLKIPSSMISDSLSCSIGLICGYVNQHLEVQSEKKMKLRLLLDFCIDTLEKKIGDCKSGITEDELFKLKQLIEKGRCILHGRRYKNPKTRKSRNNRDQFGSVHIGGGH
jgi:hypothetical protein